MGTPNVLFLAVLSLASLTACKAGDVGSPLVDLANRLYLDGEWSWADSMVYSNYVPDGESVPHRGSYILEGTATLEPGDSSAAETYVLSAVANLMHVDSTGDSTEVVSWVVADITFEDTVEVVNDTIYNLSVEPIPPQANANTDLIRWLLSNEELWCTNWLTDTLTAGNGDGCQTAITWVRTGPRTP